VIAKSDTAAQTEDGDTANARQATERLGLSLPNRHWESLAEKHPGIESNPFVYEGRPVLRGTRVPVSVVIGYLTLGPGREQLLRDYPSLDADGIKQAVDFALGLLEG
jgi:uncharacterized protein (DUF433 family)